MLEQKIGYDKVIDICEDYFGHPIDAHTIPESAEKMLGFKKLIREEVKKQNKVL